jgi:hypothetical protein
MFTPVVDVLSQTLEWRQPAVARRTYVLHAGDRVCAELACTRWGFQGDGRAQDGRWRFTHALLWWSDPRAVSESGESVATFEHRFLQRGGRILLASRAYSYRTEGFFRQVYIVNAPDGRDLFRLERSRRWFRTEGRLTFHAAVARECRDLSLLVLLAWYSMVLLAHRRHARAAAIAG